MPDERKNQSQKPQGEWVRQFEAAARLRIPRTTLVGRMARGEFKTKRLGGVVFVWVDADTEERHRKAS
jgi:hypothetical protein